MEDRTPPYFPDEILDAIGDKSAIFQDVLNVGLPLNEVEIFSDWARAEGMTPVTVSDLRELRSHEVYGRLAGLVLDAAVGRLIHEL
jgi:hypothetical protein